MAGTFIGDPWKLPYTAQQIQDVITNGVPVVGDNGNWWRWDISTSGWVDTGVTVATSLSDNAVITSKLADGSVTTPKLADGAVTWPKLAPEARKSNDNLLDNAYFIGGGSQQGNGEFPVNQRGLLEYAGAVYGIDRWLINASGGKITVQPDGVLYTNTSPTNSFMQRFPRGLYPGKIMTLSFLVDLPEVQSDFALTGLASNYTNTMIFEKRFTPQKTGLQLFTGTMTVPQTGLFGVGLYTYGENEVKLLAAKLEFGPIQTLAHESAGGWILNDPAPNYTDEMMRCMRFYIYGELRGSFSTIKDGSKGWIFVPLSVTLIGKPALIGTPILQDVDTASRFTPETLTVETLCKNGVLLNYTPTTKKCICYGTFGFDANI